MILRSCCGSVRFKFTCININVDLVLAFFIKLKEDISTAVRSIFVLSVRTSSSQAARGTSVSRAAMPVAYHHVVFTYVK